MSNKFQSIKGFYDILPEATPLWFKLEDTARRVLGQYGYKNKPACAGIVARERRKDREETTANIAYCK